MAHVEGKWNQDHNRWTTADGEISITRVRRTDVMSPEKFSGVWLVQRRVGGGVGSASRFSEARKVVAGVVKGEIRPPH